MLWRGWNWSMIFRWRRYLEGNRLETERLAFLFAACGLVFIHGKRGGFRESIASIIDMHPLLANDLASHLKSRTLLALRRQ